MTPPPALDVEYTLRGGELWRDPWDDYRRLRDESPVHRSEDPEYGEFFVLSRFTDVFDAVRDTEAFSSAQGLTLDPKAMAAFEGRAAPIVMMDPPEHTAMRRLVGRPMTPRRVAEIEPEVAAFISARLDELGDGRDEIDIIEALFKPLPSSVVAHYLGVPSADRARFDVWTNAIVAASASGDVANAADAFTQLFEYASELIERRRQDPGTDLVSELVGAGAETADAGWIVGFVFTMVTGGNDTTTGLLGGAAELLTAHRDQRRILLDEPRRIRGAVDEFLRLTSPVQNLARTTTRDVAVDGHVIPRDRKVMLLYGSANRDEREFGTSAAALDVTREIPRMVSFGYGAHHCLGAAAARLAGGLALEALLRRFPAFEVDAARGRFAPGPFVRRYENLPFVGSA